MTQKIAPEARSDASTQRCPNCKEIIAVFGHAPWCRPKDRKPKAIQQNLLQLPLGFSGPRVRGVDPDTSKEAAQSITEKRLTEIQQDILEWFRTVRRATDEELEHHFREKYPAQTTVSKRRTDLVRLGYLRDSGHRRTNSNMRRMIRLGVDRMKNIPLGFRFGRLEVLDVLSGSRIQCRCDCGTITVKKKRNLVRGITRSCGCLRVDVLRARPRMDPALRLARANDSRRRYRQTHRQQMNAYARRYTAAHPEKRKEYKRRYLAAHPERERARRKRHYMAHRKQMRERNAKYSAAHREQLRTYAKQYVATHREQLRLRSRQYFAEHREEIYERNAKYRAAHREQLRTHAKQYAAAHREQIRENRARHRSRCRLCMEFRGAGTTRPSGLCSTCWSLGKTLVGKNTTSEQIFAALSTIESTKLKLLKGELLCLRKQKTSLKKVRDTQRAGSATAVLIAELHRHLEQFGMNQRKQD